MGNYRSRLLRIPAWLGIAMAARTRLTADGSDNANDRQHIALPRIPRPCPGFSAESVIGSVLWGQLPVLKGYRLLFTARPRPQTKTSLHRLVFYRKSARSAEEV